MSTQICQPRPSATAKPKRPCSYPGCRELVSDTKYCERHSKHARRLRPCRQAGCRKLTRYSYCDEHWNQFRGKDNRPSAGARGYGHRWRWFRRYYLSKHPICEGCKMRGLTVPAIEVHHKIKIADQPELQYRSDNCVALCKSCHSKVTWKGR